MSECKMCGAANSPDSSVCVKCGAELRVNRKKRTAKKKNKSYNSAKKVSDKKQNAVSAADEKPDVKAEAKPKVKEEIFSNSDHSVQENKEETYKDVYSSDEAREKARKETVLEKIYEMEEVIGDRSEIVEDEQKIVPTVINRTSSTDIIRTSSKSSKDKKHDIPRRVIHSVQNAESTKDAQLSSQRKRKKRSPYSEETIRALAESETSDSRSEKTATKIVTMNKTSGKKQPVYEEQISAEASTETEPTDTAEDKIVEKISEIAAESSKEIIAENITENITENIIEKSGETVAAMSVSKNSLHRSASIESTADEEDETMSEAEIDEALTELETTSPEKEELPADEKTEAAPIPLDEDDDKEEGSPAETDVEVKNESADTAEEAPVVRSREIPEIASRLAKEKKAKAVEKNDAEPKKKTTKKRKKKPVEGSTDGNTKDGDTIKTGKKPAKSDAKDGGEPVKKKKKSKPADNSSANGGEPVKKKKKAKPADRSDGKSADGDRNKNVVLSQRRELAKKPRFTKEDIEENRYIAALAYLGVLIIVPFFKRDESKFCKAHVKQGVAVLLWTIAVLIVTLAAVLGLRALLLWVLGLNVIVYKITAYIVTAVMLTLVFIPVFDGAQSAFSGRYEKVMFVGKFVKQK